MIMYGKRFWDQCSMSLENFCRGHILRVLAMWRFYKITIDAGGCVVMDSTILQIQL